MKKTIFATLCLVLLSANLYSQTPATENEKAILAEMLTDFLQGAAVNDADIHDNFWAEELIYTGSEGNRITKQDIMDNLAPAPSGAPAVKYSAENVDIRVFGETAVVAFRLVAEMVSTNRGPAEKQFFYNTGTFIKQAGSWKVMAWQATKTQARD